EYALNQSPEPSHVVDDRESGDVVEEGVDGEIAAKGILLRSAEGVVPPDQALPGLDLGQAPEGGHLDDLPPEAHVAEPEPAPDDEAVPEELLDLLGMRV